jgi:tetratricopeptide (TPR) repeat protein
MNHIVSAILAACLFALAPVLSAFSQTAQEKEAQELVAKAQEMGKAQKYDEAIALMKKAIQLAPRNDLYLALTSDLEYKAGKFADGAEHALQAIKLNDKVGAYYTLVISNSFSDQELDRAREYCDLVLKGGPKQFGQGPFNDARILQDLLVKKTYIIYWNLDPQKVRLPPGPLAIAMPKTDLPNQTVTYEIGDVKSQKFVKGDTNDILYVVPQGNKPFTLTTRIIVEPKALKKELAVVTARPLPAEVRTYLGPCAGIDPRSPVLTKVVADLKGKNNAETARNIVEWMKKNIEYKLEKKSVTELDFKAVDEIVQRKHAECRGQAMLFVGLCRAADIPARTIWGFKRIGIGSPDKQVVDIASHNWAEFYVPGIGWVPVDPQNPESLGCLPTSCMRIFMDVKKTKTSTELVPMINLLYMNGDKVKFDESR